MSISSAHTTMSNAPDHLVKNLFDNEMVREARRALSAEQIAEYERIGAYMYNYDLENDDRFRPIRHDDVPRETVAVDCTNKDL